MFKSFIASIFIFITYDYYAKKSKREILSFKTNFIYTYIYTVIFVTFFSFLSYCIFENPTSTLDF